MTFRKKTYKRRPSPSLQNSQLKDQGSVLATYLATELQELENVLVLQDQAQEAAVTNPYFVTTSGYTTFSSPSSYPGSIEDVASLSCPAISGVTLVLDSQAVASCVTGSFDSTHYTLTEWYLQAKWYNASSTLLSTEDVATVTGYTLGNPSTGSIRLTAHKTPPAGATRVDLKLRFRQMAGSSLPVKVGFPSISVLDLGGSVYP